jgi:DNA-binding CsgD family transcriptional regulator
MGTTRIRIDLETRTPPRGRVSIDGGTERSFLGWAELRAALEGPDGALADLTPMELRIATLVGDGLTNKEIAGVTFLSPRTIQWHLTRTFKKLGVRSRTELVAKLLGPDHNSG